jgi:hypothetical protein
LGCLLEPSKASFQVAKDLKGTRIIKKNHGKRSDNVSWDTFSYIIAFMAQITGRLYQLEGGSDAGASAGGGSAIQLRRKHRANLSLSSIKTSRNPLRTSNLVPQFIYNDSFENTEEKSGVELRRLR